MPSTVEIVDSYKDAIIQIATQTGTGTGFYLKQYNLIKIYLYRFNKTNSIDISGLANGIYLLKVISSDNSQNYTTRFCIAK